MGMSLTKKVLTATTVGLLIYEGWTLFNAAEGDTLSEGVWDVDEQFPVLGFKSGFLMGHWFHNNWKRFAVGFACGALAWRRRMRDEPK